MCLLVLDFALCICVKIVKEKLVLLHTHSHTDTRMHARTHACTHTHLTALFPGRPRWAGTRKVKPIWILLKQETVSGSGISWAVFKSAPRSRQTTTPAPHHSVFLQARCPFCCPTNSVKELKAKKLVLLLAIKITTCNVRMSRILLIVLM